jgi:hypothetical protein
MNVRLACLLFAGAVCGVLTPTLARAGSMVTCSYQAGGSAVPGYVNKDGRCVPRPASSSNEGSLPATAQCRDGRFSYSQHRSGTCSGHGGVARWMPRAPASSPAPVTNGDKIVDGEVWRCTDASDTVKYSTEKCEGGALLFTYRKKQGAQ